MIHQKNKLRKSDRWAAVLLYLGIAFLIINRCWAHFQPFFPAQTAPDTNLYPSVILAWNPQTNVSGVNIRIRSNAATNIIDVVMATNLPVYNLASGLGYAFAAQCYDLITNVVGATTNDPARGIIGAMAHTNVTQWVGAWCADVGWTTYKYDLTNTIVRVGTNGVGTNRLTLLVTNSPPGAQTFYSITNGRLFPMGRPDQVYLGPAKNKQWVTLWMTKTPQYKRTP
jgi:hypothetical protein